MSSQESFGSNELDGAAIAKKLVKDAKSLADEMEKAPAEGFNSMRDDVKRIMQKESLEIQRVAWNSLSEETRKAAASSVDETHIIIFEIVRLSVDAAKYKQEKIRNRIKENLDDIVVHTSPDEVIFLLNLFLRLQKTIPNNTKSERRSLEVLSGMSEAVRTADKITTTCLRVEDIGSKSLFALNSQKYLAMTFQRSLMTASKC